MSRLGQRLPLGTCAPIMPDQDARFEARDAEARAKAYRAAIQRAFYEVTHSTLEQSQHALPSSLVRR